jgi:cytochrome b6-f complex iron-sulfur subunit
MLDRRAFLLCGASAAAALGALGCTVGVTTAPSSVSGSLKVSDYATLAAVGGIALVTVSGADLAIVRTAPTTFLALSRVCPHQGAIINESGAGFTCPRHGAMFSATGTWVGGQITSNLRSYATSYDAATGTLTVG